MVSGHFEEHHGNDCLCIIILVEIIKRKTISRRHRISKKRKRSGRLICTWVQGRNCRILDYVQLDAVNWAHQLSCRGVWGLVQKYNMDVRKEK